MEIGLYNREQIEKLSQIREGDRMAEYHTQQKSVLLDYLSRHSDKTFSMESLADAMKTELGSSSADSQA